MRRNKSNNRNTIFRRARRRKTSAVCRKIHSREMAGGCVYAVLPSPAAPSRRGDKFDTSFRRYPPESRLRRFHEGYATVDIVGRCIPSRMYIHTHAHAVASMMASGGDMRT